MPYFRKRTNMWIAVGLLTLLLITSTAAFYATAAPGFGTTPFGAPYSFTAVFVVAVACIVALKLMHDSVVEKKRANATTGQSGVARRRLHALIIAVMILLASLFTLYWLLIWDSTYDPVGVIWLFVLTVFVLITGSAAAVAATDRGRVTALAFVFVMPFLFLVVAQVARQPDFRQRTTLRAERVEHALASYYVREGHYPDTLNRLTRRDALYLPGPLILFGQGWCYEGQDVSYRLGYVDRSHWSDPHLFGHLHEAVGDWSNHPPLCATEIAAIRAVDPHYFAFAND